MRLVFSAAVLALAWFAATNLAASALTWGAAHLLRRRGRPAPAAVLLLLRLLPASLATLFVTVAFLPAHLRFEPADADERFGLVVCVMAALGTASLVRTAGRVHEVWAAARRAGQWPLEPMKGCGADAYEVGGFPGISLAGVLRTRILVGSHARETLTAEELDLAIAHERAHRRSFDNLKRCAMFCAPDFFGWCAMSSAVEEQWRAQAEYRADLEAVNGDDRRAMHLASALVKVARLGGPAAGDAYALHWSTFHEPGLLESRVHRLVSGCSPQSQSTGLREYATLTCAAAAGASVWLTRGAFEIHRLTEALIAVLP